MRRLHECTIKEYYLDASTSNGFGDINSQLTGSGLSQHFSRNGHGYCVGYLSEKNFYRGSLLIFRDF